MPAYETANVEVRVAGDVKNTVFKYRVTAPEIMLLRAIHGDDSIVDIMPLPADQDVKRSAQNERARLRGFYGARDAESNDPVIDHIWPGAGAVLPVTIGELELPEHAFKPVTGARYAPRSTEGTAPKQSLISEDQEEDLDLEDEDDTNEVPADDFLADEDDGTETYGSDEENKLETADGDVPWLNTIAEEEAAPAAAKEAPVAPAKPATAKKNKAVPL